MDKNKINNIVRYLINKRLNKYFITNFDSDLIPSNQAEAYYIQNTVHNSINSEYDDVIGRKIGCTTKVMQNYLKIDHPCAGTIRKSNSFKSGDNLELQSYTKAGVECEIAVKLKNNIPFGDNYTQEDILIYIDSIFPAIEVVDDRYDNWKNFSADHLIADDFFSAGCVLGREEFKVDFKNIELIKGTMYVNDKEIGQGLGKHILGNPLNALIWLAGRKDIIGNFIPKNSIILLGSLVETYWVSKGDKVEINIEGMDSVYINFI